MLVVSLVGCGFETLYSIKALRLVRMGSLEEFFLLGARSLRIPPRNPHLCGILGILRLRLVVS
jgi:hypothetical protein